VAEYPTDKNRRSSAKSWSRGVSSKRGTRSPRGKLMLKPSKKELLKQAIQEEKAKQEEQDIKEQLLEDHKNNIARDDEDNVVFRPNPGPQTLFLAAPEKEVLFGGAAGGGKVVQKGDSVLTPKGFVKIEDLHVGDTICHPKGGTQTVKHLFAWETLPKWIVYFSDGTRLDVAEEHLWYAWRARVGRKINGVRVFGEASGKVVSTKQLQEYIEKGYKPQIPVCDEQYFDSKSVSIDPYLLGVLIGDGCLTTNQITITCDEDDKDHYKQYIPTDKWDTKKTIRFGGEYRKELVECLISYGLMHTRSSTKFIPHDYLINSADVRWAVAQGLMDTDGYSAPDKNAVYYYTVSEQLAKDAASLFRSLGACVTITDKIGSYRDQDGTKVLCQKVYCLYIKHNDPDKFFRMQRKQHGKFGKGLVQKSVIKVEQKGVVEGRCISVSSDDGLYVTENFTVTHNSYALLADCMRGVIYSDYVALILRRTNDELRELKQKSKEMYPKIDPGARWSEKNSEWTFSSGARIWMTYLDRDDDVGRYHGQAFSYIAFDELTYWPTPYAWDFLRSRLRTTNPNITPYMRATTNPGGPGHSWVKKMFIDPAPWGKAFDATDIQTGETLLNPETGQPLFKRRFIPSKLSDNPYLATSGYLESLLALPEDKRKALLYGSWDVAEGAAFKEFSRVKHVIEPFELPSGVKTFRACDYGYSSYSAVVWLAVMPSGQIIIVDELYVKEVNAVELAHMVNERDKKWQPSYGVLDSSCWAKRGDVGQSIAETMIKLGCRWKPSDRSKGSRVAGKNMIHQMLADDPILDEPKLLIFDTCVNTISYLPVIPLDKNNNEDVDTKYEHDHVYDAVRYGIMSRPRSKSVFDFGDNITQMRNERRSGAGRYFY